MNLLEISLMNDLEAIKNRRSIRKYKGKPIENEKREILEKLVQRCNEEGNLNIFICYDDPLGFDSKLAHYGNFYNVENYIVLSGTKSNDLDIRAGYYGEKLVIEAQKLGFNTCWVALTFNKNRVKKFINSNQSLVCVIALGYGDEEGHVHKNKDISKIVTNTDDLDIEWFKKGVIASLLAPTALNQQKFKIQRTDNKAIISISGFGPYARVDLGIVKYHFETASGHETTVF